MKKVALRSGLVVGSGAYTRLCTSGKGRATLTSKTSEREVNYQDPTCTEFFPDTNTRNIIEVFYLILVKTETFSPATHTEGVKVYK